ncbi:transposase [Streptomyces adustus]|uniref:transposase n=1 Tax=Streptomyces adustus TaxID=1609272 RepID=UPI00371D3A7E
MIDLSANRGLIDPGPPKINYWRPPGKNGGNSRNGKRSKMVLTDVGPVEITVPPQRRASKHCS